jgi:hypothetical protein
MKKGKPALRLDDIDTVGKIFEKFAAQYQYQYNHADIFMDVLNAMLHIATIGKDFASEYADACERYGAQPLHALIETIAEYSANFYDALGTIYEYIVITKGKSSALGQFFTPQPVALLTASIVQLSPEEGRQQNVSDPCSGSGRMLLATGKMYGQSRWKQMFWAQDIDIVSVKMTTLNLWLNIIPAIITHGDTLAITVWNAYEVVLNWERDPQADGGGRWLAFVVRLSGKECEALQDIFRQPTVKQGAIMKGVNAERVKNVEAHIERGGVEPKPLSPEPPASPPPAPPKKGAQDRQQQLF